MTKVTDVAVPATETGMKRFISEYIPGPQVGSDSGHCRSMPLQVDPDINRDADVSIVLRRSAVLSTTGFCGNPDEDCVGVWVRVADSDGDTLGVGAGLPVIVPLTEGVDT